jgi:hypothetical protein
MREGHNANDKDDVDDVEKNGATEQNVAENAQYFGCADVFLGFREVAPPQSILGVIGDDDWDNSQDTASTE